MQISNEDNNKKLRSRPGSPGVGLLAVGDEPKTKSMSIKILKELQYL